MDAENASIIAAENHQGESYIKVLGDLHRFLAPKNYFEIGTNTGDSLILAKCPTVAVDPLFRITQDLLIGKPSCHFMQMPSDAFFAHHSPEALLGDKIHLAFLDGMHWYDYLLRDFSNTEKHCRPNSVIVIHDCIPTDAFVARRDPDDMTLHDGSPNPGWWAGDIWKTIAILQKVRPDLRIHAFDAPPTGLIMITNLDPSSRVLDERYFELVEGMRKCVAEDGSLKAYIDSLNVKSTAEIDSWSKASEYFWL